MFNAAKRQRWSAPTWILLGLFVGLGVGLFAAWPRGGTGWRENLHAEIALLLLLFIGLLLTGTIGTRATQGRTLLHHHMAHHLAHHGVTRRPHIYRRMSRALFTFINCGLCIALLSGLADFTGSPFVFPSLGPTAYLIFATPLAPGAAPRNTLLGHVAGVLFGWTSLVLFSLDKAPPVLETGVSLARVGAATFALAGTCGWMALTGITHPPAGATTLIVALGFMHIPQNLVVLLGGVFLLTAQGVVINRLAGVPYPVWGPN